MKIEHRGAPREYLTCLDAVLLTLLKAGGLEDEVSLLGRRGFLVVPEGGLEISPRILPAEREWSDCLDLVRRPLETASELDDAILDALGRGQPVCLSVDLFSWPHTPHFGRRRQRHYLAVFGAEDGHYHVVCPYYAFEGPVPAREIHDSYRHSGNLEGLITVERFSERSLPRREVEALAAESCACMLGLDVPEGLEGVDPGLLGCAGIRTFADRLEALIAGHGEGLHRIHGLADLSRYLMAVGYARHWFSRLLSGHGLAPPTDHSGADPWAGSVQAWIGVGKRLAMGLYGRRDALVAQSLRRVAQLATVEEQLFTALRGVLGGKGPGAPRGVREPESVWPARPPYDAPRNAAERTLAAAFAEVLGLGDKIGRDDGFFQLGGDSVVLIQLMSKVRDDFGVTLDLHTVFESPTVAELAGRLGADPVAGPRPAAAPAARAATPADGPADRGPLALTPSQEGSLSRPRAFLNHRNLARFSELRRELDDDILSGALAAVLHRHPALGAHFEERHGEERHGEERHARWVQHLDPHMDVPYTSIDLGGLPASEHRAAMEQAASELHGQFRLDRTPLLRFVRFARGPGRADRLFTLFHHVLVDGYSCDVIFEDFSRACDQLERGDAVDLGPAATPFRTWVERLQARASSPEVSAELESWLALPFHRLRPLPADRPDGRDVYRYVARVARRWDPATTRRLTGPAAVALGTTVAEIVAAALLRTLADWTGHPVQAIHEFQHGRTPDFAPDLDVSRTVGYLSYSHPVVVEVPPVDPASGGDPAADVREITRQKRRIRGGGLGYSLLRFLHP
ncbi:MAG: condensation domain-containing protein, partial [Acidobacteriota bacterium]